MEKSKLKKLRTSFKELVFLREKNVCAFCDHAAVDAHHITDRHLMPNDGYSIKNGIALCSYHHILVEQFNVTKGKWWFSGYGPNDLYEKIASSYEEAFRECRKL